MSWPGFEPVSLQPQRLTTMTAHTALPPWIEWNIPRGRDSWNMFNKVKFLKRSPFKVIANFRCFSFLQKWTTDIVNIKVISKYKWTRQTWHTRNTTWDQFHRAAKQRILLSKYFSFLKMNMYHKLLFNISCHDQNSNLGHCNHNV